MSQISDYVREITRCGSVSAAAKAFSLSQPTMSLHIKRLEEQLDAKVFDRVGQTMVLTDAGRAYLSYAGESERLLRRLKSEISDLTQLKTGRLYIGGSSCFNAGYFPKALAVFSSLYPGVDVSIVNGRIPDIAEKAAGGELDIFITPRPVDNEALMSEKLFEEDIYLCVPQGAALESALEAALLPQEAVMSGRAAGLPRVSCGALAPLIGRSTFISLNGDQHIGQVARQLFETCGAQPARLMYSDQMLTSFALTLGGVGLSLITESTMRWSNFRRTPGFLLPDSAAARRSMYVAYSRGRCVSRATKEFVRILKESLSEAI